MRGRKIKPQKTEISKTYLKLISDEDSFMLPCSAPISLSYQRRALYIPLKDLNLW